MSFKQFQEKLQEEVGLLQMQVMLIAMEHEEELRQRVENIQHLVSEATEEAPTFVGEVVSQLSKSLSSRFNWNKDDDDSGPYDNWT